MRKERRDELRKENGFVHRFVNWIKPRKNQSGQIHPGIPSVESDRTESSGTSLSMGSDDPPSVLDQAPSSAFSEESNTNSSISDQNNIGEELPARDSLPLSSNSKVIAHDERLAESDVSSTSPGPEEIIQDKSGARNGKNDEDESSAEDSA